MLILSRKTGESIKIGDNITIKVCEIYHDKVRIGLDCPKDIRIMRTELLEQQPKAETK